MERPKIRYGLNRKIRLLIVNLRNCSQFRDNVVFMLGLIKVYSNEGLPEHRFRLYREILNQDKSNFTSTKYVEIKATLRKMLPSSHTRHKLTATGN